MLPPSTPDLIALDLLDSVAELGSLGRAAGRHRMSQPAVSMRMSQLERRLGLTLLQRGPAGARLTPVGERVVALSRRVLSEARELMAGVEALVAERGSHLRVAASLTVAEYLLPGWLAALHRESPDVILAVEVTNSAHVEARVAEHHADVGFVESHHETGEGMSAVVVRTDRLVVVVDPGHPWARARTAVTAAQTGRDRADRPRARLGHPRDPGRHPRRVWRAAVTPGTGLHRGDPGRCPARRRTGGAQRPGSR